MKQKILTIMFASVMAMLAFTACNNDDEPQEPSGEKMVENIDKIIADQAEDEVITFKSSISDDESLLRKGITLQHFH